ncbi:chorismate-binding protein [Salmonella enterica subsp. enterica]|nr:chorismate-binding protein [Salmonella enterica subsp. enterica]
MLAPLPPASVTSLHATDLLRAAFPAGSITGAPKVRATEIIDELEPQRRNACAAARLSGVSRQDGWLQCYYPHRHGNAGPTLYCSAGGGIVAEQQRRSGISGFDKVNVSCTHWRIR